MKWITRERVKVDRVACPWLINKFVDPEAEFLFVPTDQVVVLGEREGAIRYDVPGVELGHHGMECSFEAILKRRQLSSLLSHLHPKPRLLPAPASSFALRLRSPRRSRRRAGRGRWPHTGQRRFAQQVLAIGR
jgi:hypothetical protein